MKTKIKKISLKKGISLVELLVSLGILGLIIASAGIFQRDVFSLNYFLQGSLNAQIDARHVVKIIVTELRKAGPSATGAYPITIASSTAVTFYSDVDNNGIRDKVRYFVSGTNVIRGVVTPTGSPLAYNDATEKLTTIIGGFVASSTLPLFQYYPSTYAGTSSPMTIPVDVSAVRLIKVTVIIDKDINKSPSKLIVTSQVNLRNLKDNL